MVDNLKIIALHNLILYRAAVKQRNNSAHIIYCLLKTLQVQLDSPLGYDAELANHFSAMTSS